MSAKRTETNPRGAGRKKTRVDGRQVCFWLPSKTIEIIDETARALGQTRGAVIVAAVNAYATEEREQTRLTQRTLAKIQRLIDKATSNDDDNERAQR